MVSYYFSWLKGNLNGLALSYDCFKAPRRIFVNVAIMICIAREFSI